MRKYLSILLLIFILAFSLVIPKSVYAKTQLDTTYTGSRDAFGNWVFSGYTSTYNPSYYSSITATTKSELISQLNSLIYSTKTKTLTYKSYDSSNYSYTGTVIADAQEDPNNHNNCLCLYTGVSYAKSSANDNWNCEHIWPQSHNVSGERKSDAHHLCPTSISSNSARGNKDFGEVSQGTTFGSINGTIDDRSTNGSQIFEPRDSVKGDVARMLFYMDIMYPELTLVSSAVTSNQTSYLGNLETLLLWNEQDPVDDFERRKNDVVEYYQGNRNPFIDHPEYVSICFGASTDTFSVSYVIDKDTTFSYSDTSKYKENELVKKPITTPTKKGYEFVGWYSDKNLTKQWDFSTSKITSDLKLYPKFSKSITLAYSISATVKNGVANNIYLNFKYELTKEQYLTVKNKALGQDIKFGFNINSRFYNANIEVVEDIIIVSLSFLPQSIEEELKISGAYIAFASNSLTKEETLSIKTIISKYKDNQTKIDSTLYNALISLLEEKK